MAGHHVSLFNRREFPAIYDSLCSCATEKGTASTIADHIPIPTIPYTIFLSWTKTFVIFFPRPVFLPRRIDRLRAPRFSNGPSQYRTDCGASKTAGSILP